MKLVFSNSLLTLFIFYSQLTFSQETGNIKVDEILNIPSRKEINIPNILGYQTLKCDFHIHTLYSDGIVWPSYRVDEAWEEGLDAIAITDHIERHPKNPYLIGDDNTSFELAEYKAKEKGIILIKGGEITRGMPPGHINAIFLEDVNALDTPDVMDAIKEAANQGAFIFWNHPGWKSQQPDTCIMFPTHNELIKKGLLQGIEVFNEKEWYPIALKWCHDYNLAIIGNSDIHDVVSHKYDLIRYHRPMTLVFAKGKNSNGIKEALFDRRTVIYFGDYLIGQEKFLKAILKASINIEETGFVDSKKHISYRITNSSCTPFDIENSNGSRILIPANGSILIRNKNNMTFKGEVTNLITELGKPLRFSFYNK